MVRAVLQEYRVLERNGARRALCGVGGSGDVCQGDPRVAEQD